MNTTIELATLEALQRIEEILISIHKELNKQNRLTTSLDTIE